MKSAGASTHRAHGAGYRSAIGPAVLAAIALIILSRGILQEGLCHSDDARHAIDGVLMMDLFRDMPVAHLYDYLVQYYAKYPALGIGTYPPFFAIIEAGFFALFGISVASAKAAVLFFALVALVYWYRLVRLVYGERIAFFSSLLFITTPYIVFWSKAVMLEMPALAMVVLSVYCFYNFVELEKRGYAIPMAFATAAAGYTKQTAVFIVPLFIIYLVLSGKARRLLSRDMLLSSLLLVVLVIPLAVITVKTGKTNLMQAVGPPSETLRLASLEQWYIYPVFLYTKLLTPPVLVLSAISLIWTVINREERKRGILFLAWILGFYLTFTYIAEKITRYAYFWIPPFTLFAAIAVDRVRLKAAGVSAAVVVIALLVAYQTALTFSRQPPFIHGYEEAARYVLEQDADRVFYQGGGLGNGNFIFYVRQFDDARKMVVFRGDKLLATSVLFPGNLVEEYAGSAEEVSYLLGATGARYFVIDEKAVYGIRAFEILREVLASDSFELVKRVDMRTNIPWRKGDAILIYRLKKQPEPTMDTQLIKIPIAGTELKVSMKTLGNFYTPSEKAGAGQDM